MNNFVSMLSRTSINIKLHFFWVQDPMYLHTNNCAVKSAISFNPFPQPVDNYFLLKIHNIEYEDLQRKG